MVLLEAKQVGDWLSSEYCSCAGHFHLSVKFSDLMAGTDLNDVRPKDIFLILLFHLVSQILFL